VSASRPEPVVIRDLAEPRFDPETEGILALMAELGSTLELEPRALMAAAVEQTGLDDFGPPDFGQRLEVLCRALRTEAGLNAAGVAAQHMLLTGLLRNRLLVESLIDRHPEILSLKVARPIVICGLPRTGTTHLHNLISADPAWRSLPYWESLEPVLPEGDRPGPGEPDPRRLRTEQALSFVNKAMPYFNRMHDMTVDHVHEEIQLLAIDFSSMLFETIAPMPMWRDHYLSRDQRPSYAYLKKVLQVLQWLRGGTRWVLKSPQHLEQFPALYETFPDATFVVTHRDPVSVTASMLTMLAYTARLAHDRVDLAGIARYWTARLEHMLRACVRDRDLLPATQSIDLPFDELVADDAAMVRRVYDLAGQAMGPESSAAMARFMALHPRGRHGGVHYDLSPFGVSPGELRQSLSFYVERFGVTPES
jgi:Sulfotransferase family